MEEGGAGAVEAGDHDRRAERPGDELGPARGLVAGHGADFTATVDADGYLAFRLPGPFTFSLYEYVVS